ncbi:iron(III) transport system permease protein [Rhizobium flavum]|uniref:Iron(III) transport system permease protein n=2 Tax=Pseudorhizobium flavum TaxID=1335061 RepID=A0A7X0DCN7_9HYPH|nr:iron(III) transport system permease protein [Pseudorhizobium flavum]CAD6598215.1 iron ABC transporter permease [Pseudorhizobium flavum]
MQVPPYPASRPPRRPRRATSALAIVTAAVVAMPVIAVVWIALQGGDDTWRHVASTVIPRASLRTLQLLGLTGLVCALVGTLTAWLVTSYEFPMRSMLSVMLVLPLAIPSYLAAYAFGEFMDFTGPLQTAYRAAFGFQSSREYWFPDIRSMGGAVLVLSSVLYPYVYLACRSMFLMQGRAAADVARTLGASPARVFWRIQIPMARPAIMIGLTLVTMETLNDIGAVQFLGINTLTFSVYDTWLNRGSLSGAAQIAAVMLGIVALLIWLEQAARRSQRFSTNRTTGAVHDVVRTGLTGAAAAGATAFCLLPVVTGFAIPVVILGGFASRRLADYLDPRLLDALWNSLVVSSLTAMIAVLFGLVLAYSIRNDRSSGVTMAGRIASLGYGVPGTVLAIGVLIPMAGFDNAVDGFLRSNVGISTGLLLSGSGAAIVYACTARFMTMAEGTLEAGFHKLSPHLDMAARTLGRNQRQTLATILLPNLGPALMTAALMVFIETMKELSATMLLRPFNFNTLATLVYEDASRARIEDASVAAMIIILAGLIPVLIVSRSLDRQR